MRDDETPSAMRTYVLEDPDGSLRALRAWGGADARLEVFAKGRTPVVLVGEGARRRAEGEGLRLSVAPEALRAPGSGTTVSVRIADGCVWLNGAPAVGLSSATVVPNAACEEWVAIGELPACIGSRVQALTVLRASRVTDLVPLRTATAVRDIAIVGAPDLKDLSPLATLPALTTLMLSECSAVVDLAPLATIHTLTKLSLSANSNIEDVSPLAGLHALATLRLSSCRALKDVSALKGLRALTSLDLSSCAALTDVSPLSGLHALTTLHLSRCEALTDVSPLSGLHALRTLNLSFCKALTDVSGLNGLPALTTLNLSYCRSLSTVSALNGLHALTTLNLNHCIALKDVSALAGLHALTTLNLGYCRALTDVSALAGLHALTALRLSQCEALKDVSSLKDLHALTMLQLSSCEALTDISALSNLHALTTLNLGFCSALTDVSALSNLHALTTLNLSSCKALTESSALSSLHALTTLNLSSCEALTDISALSNANTLTTLDASDCRRITLVAPLRACRALTSLDLNTSGNVRDLDTLSELASLRKLTWTEDAAPYAVLAATAVLRGDADTVQASAHAWLDSVSLSKAPDTFGVRLVRAFALGKDAPWAADALTRLATALRERARDDEDPQIITPATWAAWAEAALALEEAGLRAALEAVFTTLDDTREIDPLLTPVLTALADLGPASPRGRRPAPEWLVPRVREVLAPLAERPDPARRAAPAAAVFFAGFGLDADVRVWLERGTHADAPHWRDRVVLALLTRAVRRDDLTGARRWFAELVTDEARDAARAALAGALAARLPVDAAAELEAIGDESLRGRVARQLGTEPALLATPEGLYALVLALQDDAEALGATLVALVEAHPESALVAALARDLAPEPPTAGADALVARLRALDPDELTAKAALEVVRELHAMVTA